MALNFPSGQADGFEFTAPNGTTWVYNSSNNAWTSKGLVDNSGGIHFKGSIDVTSDNSGGTYSNGDQYVADPGGVAHSSFTGIAGQNIEDGALLLYTGAEWVVQATGGGASTLQEVTDGLGNTTTNAVVLGSSNQPTLALAGATVDPILSVRSTAGPAGIYFETAQGQGSRIRAGGNATLSYIDFWTRFQDGSSDGALQQRWRIENDGGLTVTRDLSAQGADPIAFTLGTIGSGVPASQLVVNRPAGNFASELQILLRQPLNSSNLTKVATFTNEGLCFGTEAPTSARTLSHYEEGVDDAPRLTLAGTERGTLSNPTANKLAYTRVGNLVTCRFIITYSQWSSSGPETPLHLINLPFPVAGSSNGNNTNLGNSAASAVIISGGSLVRPPSQLFIRPDQGTSNARFVLDDNSAWVVDQAAGTGITIQGSFTYTTD